MKVKPELSSLLKLTQHINNGRMMRYIYLSKINKIRLEHFSVHCEYNEIEGKINF
jgi:hypothetical protein